MDDDQKIYWLTEAMLLDPVHHQAPLWEYVGKDSARIAHLCGCLNPINIDLSADVLGKLIDLFLGAFYSTSESIPNGSGKVNCNDPGKFIAIDLRHDNFLNQLITSLGRLATDQAAQELERLLQLPVLHSFKSRLEHTLHQLKLTQREQAFNFSLPEKVAQILANQTPISSADLAALALDYLNDIANRIQVDGDDGFNAFWNIKTVKNEITQKMEEVREHRSENLCRDALLTRLDMSFKPLGVRCDREGDYVENNRADIRLSYHRFELPIEIKGEWHKELRTAAESQLVQQYAIDPDANGYGIYLVFWFGGTEMPSFKKDDPKPNTPEALQEILEAEFKTVNPQRIFVRVLDVTPHSQKN